MKVNGPRGAPPAGAPSGARPAQTQGFSIPTDSAARSEAAAGAARASGVSAVGSLDALLALQEAEGPTERRRRAVRRGGRILDVLEKIKLALLDGQGAGAELERLVRAVREERIQTGDSSLDGVLDEIETRAAVEMAKAEMSRLAA
ncbi:MAG: hypothetical protein K1X35_04150 [Caulobacteraceae bacterium]|nr:hypothetical protein [Caulobacteraceae bacterium]